MSTAKWQEWLSAFDPNKANMDRSPSYDAERQFRFGVEMAALRRRFRQEVEEYDPSLWRCWADQNGDCWGDTVVDHIHPISLFWSKRNRMGNLQCLCQRHNERKGNSQPLDYRPTWLRERYPN
jgi:hypothetical protein